MFSERERSAFDLGHRMADAGFALEDNPFSRLNPRLATQWARGFLGSSTLARIVGEWPRPVEPARRRPSGA
jgi:hypothetical protein